MIRFTEDFLTRHAIRHWSEHRPQMVARMTREGVLGERARTAAQRTLEDMKALTDQGMSEQVAWDETCQTWICLEQEKSDKDIDSLVEPINQ